MHTQASLITKLRLWRFAWRRALAIFYGDYHYRDFIIRAMVLMCTTAAALVCTTATVQSSEASDELTVYITQVELTPKGTRLIGPIKLTLEPWTAYAQSGISTVTPACNEQFRVSQVTATDHRLHWAQIHAVKHCVSTGQLVIQALKLQLGNVHLSVDHLAFTHHSKAQSRLYDARLSCGRLLPVTLTAAKGVMSRAHIYLEDITLRVGKLPVGWFPQLNISQSGHAGILPPSLSIQNKQVRIGLPLYLPLGIHQDLILLPGYQVSRDKVGNVFGMVSYQWAQPSASPGKLRLLGDDEFLSASGSGDARIGGWLLSAYGNTRFGTKAVDGDPDLSMEALTGFSRGVLSFGWFDRNISWGLALDRSLVEDASLHSFSQLRHQLFASTGFSFGRLGFGNTTRLRFEPTSVWLSESTATLVLNQRWWAFSAQSETQFDLQYSNENPVHFGGDTNFGIPTLRHSMKLQSVWAKEYNTTTHILGFHAAANAALRRPDRISELDTHLNPGDGFSRRVSVGLKSKNEWSSVRGEVELNAVHIGQSQYTDDKFAQVDLELEHAMGSLNTRYAHDRSLFVRTKVAPSQSVAVHTTYFARRSGVVPIDLLFIDLFDTAPTIGHHLIVRDRYSHLKGSVWLPQSHRSAHAGSLALTQHPRCECFRWTTEIKYIHRRENLWLTFQLELDLDAAPRWRTSPSI